MVAHTRSSPVEQSGEQITEIRADLTAEDGPGTVVGAAIEQQGHINALVNNAGIQPVAPFTDLADKDWAEMIGTNLTAVHRLTQAAASVMRDQGAGGSIVHIASIEARHPTPVHGHYATAKAALVMHAKAAALAWGPHGIRVNSVSPGLIDRPGLADDWPEGRGALDGRRPPRSIGRPRRHRRRLRVPLLRPLSLDNRHRPRSRRRYPHQPDLVTGVVSQSPIDSAEAVENAVEYELLVDDETVVVERSLEPWIPRGWAAFCGIRHELHIGLLRLPDRADVVGGIHHPR